jgi:hypothetical protein
MRDNNEKKVRRGDKVSIPAATWNNIVDATKAWKRQQYSPIRGAMNDGDISDLLKSNSTVLVKNSTDYDIPTSYQVMRLDAAIAETNPDPHTINNRIAFLGEIPANTDNAVCILQSPLAIGDIGTAVVSGVTVCKVKMIDEDHEWANPTPSEMGWLTSAATGQIRILDTFETGDEEELEEDIYLAVVNLIGALPGGSTPTPSVTSWKEPVRVATIASGTLAASFENGDIIDGVTLVTGNRILIKNQVAPADNGIYVVNASGAPTRATDADSATELLAACVAVTEGAVNADTIWLCTANATIIVGTTALPWLQINPTSSEVAFTSPYGVAADDTWEDTGMSITLPSAGTYLVSFHVRTEGAASALTNPNIGAGALLRLYNVTDAVVVADTIVFGMYTETVGGRGDIRNVTISRVLSVNTAKTIRLEVDKPTTGGQVTWVGVAIAHTVINYIKIG